MSENLLARAYDRLQNTYLALGVCATLAVANLVDPQELMVHADDTLSIQAERAYPSALYQPATVVHPITHLGIPVAETAATIAFAQTTTSQRKLLGMAAASQAFACGADAMVDRIWLAPIERTQPDVGFSSISDAWISKCLLDHADRRRSPYARWGLRALTLAGAGFVTVGEFMMNGADGGKLDLSSHAAGILVGLTTYAIDKRKRQR
jgi:hypothetical protein